MTQETTRLLALAEINPIHALHAAGGRIRRVHRTTFIAVYIPIPDSIEFTVVINDDASSADQYRACRAAIRHHLENHLPNTVHVFGRRVTACARCAEVGHSPKAFDPEEQRRHAMRYLRLEA